MQESQIRNDNSRKQIPGSPASLPQVRLRHFFLWMMCTAIYLATIQSIMAAERSVYRIGNAGISDTRLGFAIAMSGTINGLVLTAMTVLAGIWWRGGRQPMLGAPGHWMVLVMSLTVMLDLAGRLTLLSLASLNGESATVESLNIVTSFSFLLTFLFCALATLNVSSLIWRTTLACISFVAFADLAYVLNAIYLQLPIEFLWAPMRPISVAVVLLVMAVTLYELINYQPTDWLHNAGVMAYVAFGFLRWGY